MCGRSAALSRHGRMDAGGDADAIPARFGFSVVVWLRGARGAHAPVPVKGWRIRFSLQTFTTHHFNFFFKEDINTLPVNASGKI